MEFSGIMANPTYAKVKEGARLARESNVDMILGIGGGSVMDCCKRYPLPPGMREISGMTFGQGLA